jgi:hypothetical protein
MKPTYKIEKIDEFSFKIFSFRRKKTYFVEKKDVFFRKSGKTHKIWTCTCPSYVKWAWKTHSCKHIDLFRDIKSIK